VEGGWASVAARLEKMAAPRGTSASVFEVTASHVQNTGQRRVYWQLH
jgi:hypothetical protein